MKIKCYVNYGVLGHEKLPVYTVGCPAGRATAYETGILDIPDDLKPYETAAGFIVVMMYGLPCDINTVLRTNADGNPVILAPGGRKTRYIPLTFTPDDGNTLRRTDCYTIE